jgi:hypothetical protein
MAHTLPDLYSSICGWLDGCPTLSHPIVTMRYLDTPDGKVQVKWWGECRILAMYNVELTMSTNSEGCLHDSECVEALSSMCRRLLALDKYNIIEVRLVGTVDDPDLLDIEHTIDLKHRFLKSIVDPDASQSAWWERTRRDNQNMRDIVVDEILQLELKKGRRSSMDTLLSKCGWVRHSNSSFRLRRFSAML